MRIYSIEGNIGAGKTTLIESLEKNPNLIVKLLQKNSKNIDANIDISRICLLREPVDIWSTVKDADGFSILENFYKDPKKWSFAFQVMAFTTRLSEMRRIIKENPHCDTLICERSLEADCHIFAKMLYKDGLIDAMSYEIYLRMYREFSEEFALDGVIYLSTPPNVCFERVSKRAREGEESISIEYLEKCHRYHLNWLVCDVPNKSTFNFIMIDSNEIG